MLEPGKLYNVHGFHIYGAGSTTVKSIRTHDQIMHVHDRWGEHVLLADGDKSSGGIVNRGILTRVKIPLNDYTLVGEEIMTNRVLDTTYILSDREDMTEGMIKFLEKAERFAQQLPHGEKRDRYEMMIGRHLYDEFSMKYEGSMRITEKKIQKLQD